MVKRGYNGAGSIRERKDGRFEVRVSQEDGIRISRYTRSKKEANSLLTKLIGDVQRGITPPPERETVGGFLQRWLADCVKQTTRPATYQSYEGLIRVHILPDRIAKQRLAKLSPPELQSFLNRLQDSGVSAATTSHVHAVLRAALGRALKWELVMRNVAKLVDPPRTEKEEVHPLSPEQARQLLEAAQGDRLGALCVLAMGTGLRRGELLGLRWGDVDLEARVLRVSYALQRIKGQPVLVEPKTRRSRRAVVLPAFVVEALRRHRLRQLEERLVAGERWQERGFLFTTTLGTPLDGSNLTGWFHQLTSRAGLPRIRFHDLCHTCASLLLAQGADLRTVMEVLGHSQISLTANTYTHILPALKEDAAAKMDAILGG